MKFLMPRHLSDGRLRAYQDLELDGTEIERINAHLASCDSCRIRAGTIKERSAFVGERFQGISPTTSYTTDGLNRARLDAYLSTKEVQPMFKNIVSRHSHLLIAAVLLLTIVFSSLAFPQVRAIATNFLGLFRVEKVAVVPFNPANIPDEITNAGPRIEQMLADDVVFEEFGEVYEVASPAEASAAAGIPIRLPYSLAEPSKITVQPGAQLTFKVDIGRMRAILDEMGKEDIDIPQYLQGQTVTADLPVSVTTMYGDCQVDLEAAREEGFDPDVPYSGNSNCTVLVQLASPTVSAPPGLDIDQVGTTFLELTGMSPEEAERFSQRVDWATTLIIPVPNYSASTDVLVDGVQGVWVYQPDRGDRTRFLLAWVKNGIVYSLSGRGTLEEAIHIANSLN
jgi:hypothetical protein